MNRIITILLCFLCFSVSAQRLLTVGKTNYSTETVIPFPVVGGTFVESPAGRWGSGTGTGVSNLTIPASTDGTFQCDFELSENRGIDIGLDATSTNTDYTQYDYGLFVDATGSQQYYYIVNGTFTNSGVGATLGDKYRLRRTSGTMYAEYYRSGAWTIIFTFSGTSTAQLWPKANITFTSKYLLNPKGTGVQ